MTNVQFLAQIRPQANVVLYTKKIILSRAVSPKIARLSEKSVAPQGVPCGARRGCSGHWSYGRFFVLEVVPSEPPSGTDLHAEVVLEALRVRRDLALGSALEADVRVVREQEIKEQTAVPLRHHVNRGLCPDQRARVLPLGLAVRLADPHHQLLPADDDARAEPPGRPSVDLAGEADGHGALIPQATEDRASGAEEFSVDPATDVEGQTPDTFGGSVPDRRTSDRTRVLTEGGPEARNVGPDHAEIGLHLRPEQVELGTIGLRFEPGLKRVLRLLEQVDVPADRHELIGQVDPLDLEPRQLHRVPRHDPIAGIELGLEPGVGTPQLTEHATLDHCLVVGAGSADAPAPGLGPVLAGGTGHPDGEVGDRLKAVQRAEGRHRPVGPLDRGHENALRPIGERQDVAVLSAGCVLPRVLELDRLRRGRHRRRRRLGGGRWRRRRRRLGGGRWRRRRQRSVLGERSGDAREGKEKGKRHGYSLVGCAVVVADAAFLIFAVRNARPFPIL